MYIVSFWPVASALCQKSTLYPLWIIFASTVAIHHNKPNLVHISANMFLIQLPAIWAILLFFAPTSATDLSTLLNALKSSGASKFAQVLESNLKVLVIYLSGEVQIIFAPSDDCSYSVHSGSKRQSTTPSEEQRLLIQPHEDQTALADMSIPPGAPIETKDTSANLNGQAQKVVSDMRNSTTSGVTKRWDSPLRRHEHNYTAPASLLNIFSGIENNVSITRADILYDGGRIHIIDG